MMNMMWKWFFLCVGIMSSLSAKTEVATFAGGCFWCMQPPYDALKGQGVVKTVVGYTGGHLDNPTYPEVSSGTSGHVEAIEVYYNPEKISYQELLTVFWHNIDPTVENQQFCDKGEQYRSAIFYQNEEQKQLDEESKAKVIQEYKFPHVYTEILPAQTFYPAEDYHQEYYKKNPVRYKYYRYRCGRDKRLKQLWGTKK